MAYNDGPWSGWSFVRTCANCACNPDDKPGTAHFRWRTETDVAVDLCNSCTSDWLLNVLLDNGNARIEAL